MNVIYLVLIVGSFGGDIGGATSIPQASKQQCEQNAKYFNNQPGVKKSYCIWGVK